MKSHRLVPNKNTLIIKPIAMKKYSSLIFISASLMKPLLMHRTGLEKTKGTISTVTE
jgi:hypothetical protein